MTCPRPHINAQRSWHRTAIATESPVDITCPLQLEASVVHSSSQEADENGATEVRVSRLNPTVLDGFAAGAQARAGRNSGRTGRSCLDRPGPSPRHPRARQLQQPRHPAQVTGWEGARSLGVAETHDPGGGVTSVQGSECLLVTSNATHPTHTQLRCPGLGHRACTLHRPTVPHNSC